MFFTRPTSRLSHRLVAALYAAMLSVPSGAALADCVVLIHGLGRTSASMEPVGEFFRERDYSVVNTAYPSRSATIEELSQSTVEGGVNQCDKDAVVHFVTHSMGGILLRYYLEDHNLERLGRVVMLAPPNQGSEVVDNLRDVPGYKEILGPAGIQLGTDEDSIPSQLGPVRFELGVIAGTRTSNPILSQYLPNPDDGKVSVESTRVEGMTDFIEVPHSHPFMMTMPGVLEQIVVFIEEGSFSEYAD